MDLNTRIATFQQFITRVEAKRDGLENGPKKNRVETRLTRMNARLVKMQTKLADMNS